MGEHIVKSFDADLEALDRRIREMGGIAEDMLARAMEALAGLNANLAQRVVAADPRLDALQRAVEGESVRLIARRQPLADDLRQVIGAIRISIDLERIGDLAKNIAKRAAQMSGDKYLARAAAGLEPMRALAAAQLAAVLDAYERRDADLARTIWARDAELDALEDAAFLDLHILMTEDPRRSAFYTHLLFCSKNLERAGDHAANIAGIVIYMATGGPRPLASDLSRRRPGM